MKFIAHLYADVKAFFRLHIHYRRSGRRFFPAIREAARALREPNL